MTNKPPEVCPGKGCRLPVNTKQGSMDGAVHITYECGSKWHGWPDGVKDGFQKYPACGKVAVCPLCNEFVKKDLKGEDPEVSYMDGWHHKQCLDSYNRVPEAEAIRMSNEMKNAVAPDTVIEDPTRDEEAAKAIAAVVKLLDEDFTADTECGKHDSITLSCTGCQAAIVRTWLIDISDWNYGTEINWKKVDDGE